MNKSFLELDLRLLLARYGRHQVLQGLATVFETTVEQVESELRNLEQARGNRSRPKAKAPHEILDEISKSVPNLREMLMRLMALYQSRVFLPELRNVHAFLERRGASKNFKSRKEALSHVMRVLATLDEEGLNSLIDSAVPNNEAGSEYSMLANEIITTARRNTAE